MTNLSLGDFNPNLRDANIRKELQYRNNIM